MRSWLSPVCLVFVSVLGMGIAATWLGFRDEDKGRETTPRKILVLNEKTKSLQCLAFSPDGRLLACGNLITVQQDGIATSAITVWDIASRKAQISLRQTTEFSDLGFSPDSKFLAASGGKAVHIWDTSTWKE